MKIQLLDYTIRASLSSKTDARNVQEYADVAFGLAASGIENVELGYLADEENWLCRPMSGRIEDYYFLATNEGAEYSIMIHPTGYDIGKLPDCYGRIKRIRVLLRHDNKRDSLAYMREISSKGYKVICDIEGTYEYSDLELIQLLKALSAFDIDQVTILDATRLMDGRPVQRAALLMDNNLSPEVKIGLRSGENNGMAQFVVNNFLGTPMLGSRTVVVEGTLLGIGFISHNLCTECIADQLNEDFDGNYDYEHLIGLISIFIPGVNHDPGDVGAYHPIFYLTAKNQVDGDYGRYFLSKGVMLHEVDALLKQVAKTERFEVFDEKVAENVYRKREAYI